MSTECSALRCWILCGSRLSARGKSKETVASSCVTEASRTCNRGAKASCSTLCRQTRGCGPSGPARKARRPTHALPPCRKSAGRLRTGPCGRSAARGDTTNAAAAPASAGHHAVNLHRKNCLDTAQNWQEGYANLVEPGGGGGEEGWRRARYGIARTSSSIDLQIPASIKYPISGSRQRQSSQQQYLDRDDDHASQTQTVPRWVCFNTKLNVQKQRNPSLNQEKR